MAVTWNPADKSALLTLSGGNLIATHSAVAAFGLVRATASLGAVAAYWEVTVAPGSASMGVGFGNAAASLSNYLGSSADSIGYQANGQVYINGVLVATIATYTTGDVIRVARNAARTKAWFAVGAGGWNNDILANQNPATGAGGISLTGLSAGPDFPMAGQYTNDVATANFGASAFAYAVPSGYAPPDVNVLSATGLRTGSPILGEPALGAPVGYAISIDDTKNWEILRKRMNAIFADIDSRLSALGG